MIIFFSIGEEEELWKLSPFWVEDQRPHINPHRYGILMNPDPNLCRQKKDDGKNSIDLLIIVASGPAMFIYPVFISILASFSPIISRLQPRQIQIKSGNIILDRMLPSKKPFMRRPQKFVQYSS